MRFIGQHNLLFKARRNNFGLRLHAFAATHRSDNAQNCDALTNICRYEFCLFVYLPSTVVIFPDTAPLLGIVPVSFAPRA